MNDTGRDVHRREEDVVEELTERQRRIDFEDAKPLEKAADRRNARHAADDELGLPEREYGGSPE